MDEDNNWRVRCRPFPPKKEIHLAFAGPVLFARMSDHALSAYASHGSTFLRSYVMWNLSPPISDYPETYF
jgi:hypothetical protein